MQKLFGFEWFLDESISFQCLHAVLFMLMKCGEKNHRDMCGLFFFAKLFKKFDSRRIRKFDVQKYQRWDLFRKMLKKICASFCKKNLISRKTETLCGEM